MRNFFWSLFSLVLMGSVAHAAEPMKEWTLLVYLNGNNNLDSFGAMDINEMEKVGSSAAVNVVVQWASYGTRSVKRLLALKDNDPSKVTSPIVQDMGTVDMGDYKSLIDFVKWGVANYPAKHYFIDVWNHGNGWHIANLDGGIHATDISYDDISGHHMTTEQLGLAIKESAAIIGHKVDVYGSDACLMNMMEVAGELSNSVDVMVGSQEVEPGEGWPYDALLARWTAKSTAKDLGKVLTEEYTKSYSGGSQGNSQVTFSALDLAQTGLLQDAIKGFGSQILKMDSSGQAKTLTAIKGTQSFTFSDYGDLGDFVDLVSKSGADLDLNAVTSVKDAMSKYVIAVSSTANYAKAHGVSLWLPDSSYSYGQYSTRFAGLSFAKATGWGDVLKQLVK